ncbi:S1C family serine protease [Rugamonas rivuli]|uniref:Trypsin-like serine protease n=1 Tax=Rugamonas rivuli TaxID=2743358 RepID=A0A843SME4_9BURK|nr:S1C family serine protease [Rugamonas rivuli]MQA23648.1 trypsin-like serine protease [Rugamonas rivuli]
MRSRLATFLLFLFTSMSCWAQANKTPVKQPNAKLAKVTEASSTAFSPEEIYRSAKPSVVVVQTSRALGSGVVMLSGDRVGTWIATNAHVVAQADTVKVDVGELSVSGAVAFRDEATDVAFIKLEATQLEDFSSTRFFRLPIKTGQKVFALGAPKGLVNTFTDGIVSGVRVVEGKKLIQTTAAISPGSSGGALLNGYGELVGMTTFKVVGGEALNFAIDIEWVDQLLDALRAAEIIRLAGTKATARSLDDDFVRWLASAVTPDNKAVLAEYQRKSSEYGKNRTPEGLNSFINDLQHFADLYLSQRTVSVSAQTGTQQPARLMLVCDVKMSVKTHQLTYAIDFQAGTVNGTPAVISPTEIRYNYTNTADGITNVILDRVNGTASISSGRPVGNGPCSVSKGQAF